MSDTNDKNDNGAIENRPTADGASFINQMDESRSDEQFWIDLAQQNYTDGVTWQEQALMNQWQKNADHFNNRHYAKSLYNSPLYRGRSRVFRPLTRSSERAASAAAAKAFFSNQDVVSLRAENQNDPELNDAIKILQNALQYRLDRSIPWYLTVMGAWQDTIVYGPAWSYIGWDYVEQEMEVERPRLNMMGDTIGYEKVTENVVIKDKPYIEDLPPENVIVSPTADWRDPAGTSPYVIIMRPYSVNDIQAMMDQKDPITGEPKWRAYSTAQIISSIDKRFNAVERSREGENRPDKNEQSNRPEFQTAWVHENFVTLDGVDYVYFTLGSKLMLTDPVPVTDYFKISRRPIVGGFSVIEAHKVNPSSQTELVSGLQQSVNDIANLRADNVKLALNKRYVLRRGANIDLVELMRSVPGGGVVTDNPERDVKVIQTPDVTSSSYREQERLETESNDIFGTMLGSSVQNNRALNETVGGMEMLSQTANDVNSMDLRTFVETWMKPVLEILVEFIKEYESDEVLEMAAYRSVKVKNGQAEEMTSEDAKYMIAKAVNTPLMVRVNVGVGATNPRTKIDTMMYAIERVANIPGQAERLDGDEITKEVFAAAGFSDGDRFIKGATAGDEGSEQPPTAEQLEQARQQGIQEANVQMKQAELQAEYEYKFAKMQQDRELELARISSQYEVNMQQIQARVGIALESNQTARDSAAAKLMAFDKELEFKKTTGKPGV